MWKEDSPGAISFDTETTGLTYFDTAFCVTAAWSRPSGEIVGHYFELEKFRAHRMVWDILNKTPILGGHNLKFDLQKAQLAGLLTRTLEPAKLEDSQILAHLLDEYRPKGLKDLMVSVLDWDDTMEVEVKSGKNAGTMKKVVREKYEIQKARDKLKLKKEDGYHLIPRGIIVPYAVTDAVGTHGLIKVLRPDVQRHEDMWALYRQEMELTCVLLEMEDAGLGVLPSYVDERVKEYAKNVLKHEMRIQEITGRTVGRRPTSGICGTCGEKKNDCKCFNPASSDQLREAFTSLGFERPNYDKKQLKTIDHPLAQTIIEYRKDSKLLSTYFLAIRREQRDEILHPSFNQNVSTGRMSSGGAKED